MNLEISIESIFQLGDIMYTFYPKSLYHCLALRKRRTNKLQKIQDIAVYEKHSFRRSLSLPWKQGKKEAKRRQGKSNIVVHIGCRFLSD